MYTHYEMFVRLMLAAIFGIIIGLEREFKRKPLGLKTTIIISIFSCLLTLVSIQSAYSFPQSNHINMDPLRLAAQIIVGVGFIGAGVIMRRYNDTISGLTTAAMMWGASALGIALGANFIVEAFFGLFLLIFSVELVPFLIFRYGPQRLKEKEVSASFIVESPHMIDDILYTFESYGVFIEDFFISEVSSTEIRIKIHFSVNIKVKTIRIYELLRKIPGISFIEIENLI